MGFFDKIGGFLGNYRNSALLSNIGLGLLAGSRSMNPWQHVQQGLLAGQNSIMEMEKMNREKALFDLQMEQMRDEKQQRDSQGFAKAALFGGHDPSTDITWNQPRQGMGDNEALGLLAQAYPDQYAEGLMGQMFPKPQKPTGPMQDALALGLTPGTEEYNNYIRTRTLPKPSQTTVNVDNRGNSLPKPKEGYTYLYDGTGNVRTNEEGLPLQAPIPGGPADYETKEDMRKAIGRQDAREFYGGIVVQDGIRALDLIDEDRTLPVAEWGDLLKSIPGTGAKTLSAFLGTMKANVGFDRIQVMRNNSPTGGALGNVSNFEVDTLQATVGALDQGMEKKELKKNIIRVVAMYEAILNRPPDFVSSASLDQSQEAKAKFNAYVDAVRENLEQTYLNESKRVLEYDPNTGELK